MTVGKSSSLPSPASGGGASIDDAVTDEEILAEANALARDFYALMAAESARATGSTSPHSRRSGCVGSWRPSLSIGCARSISNTAAECDLWTIRRRAAAIG